MFFFSSIKQFFADMRRQKMRTILTTFGIFWGTASIVLLFAFGQGIRESQTKSMKGMGERIAIFWPGLTSKEYKGLPKGRRINFTEDDIRLIKNRSTLVQYISPEYSRSNATLKVGKNTTVRQVKGVWPEFHDMRNIIPDSGSRFINDNDMAERRRVIFIGNLLAMDLYGKLNVVGETVLLDGTPFTVIGVMVDKEQNSSYGGRDTRSAWIPTTTFAGMYSTRHMDNFVAQSKPEYTMKQARREINGILGGRYRFDPDDDQALQVWDVTDAIDFIRSFFKAFQYFLVGIGVATLITGGIGVSNIMNVVLEERTKEIGIKMALGARKSYVLSQFVVETLFITFLGGIVGFLFAFGIVSVVGDNLKEFVGVPSVNIYSGLLITVLLGIVGLIAGIFPARRAANLQPVQALKLF
jgi:putative ABC transport system permease protein